MKKYMISFLAALIAVSVCGCGKAADASQNQTSAAGLTGGNVNNPVQTDQNSESAGNQSFDAMSGTDGVDMDLTQLSGSMVYAQTFELLNNADKYMGQTIRIAGKFQSVVSKETSNRYYYVMVSDVTACCQQGFEFIWGDNSHVYPDEYPAENSDIVITGVLSTYEENSKKYCYLAVDDISQ